MKIITLHCDYIKFQALKKAFPKAPKLTEQGKAEHLIDDDPLVILTAIEAGDTKAEVAQAKEAIENTAKDVKSEHLVLYPYAHLSSNLASPQEAQDLMDTLEKSLKKNNIVSRAPFGYYKTFEFKCKGHPLSELSKSFGSSAEATSSTPTAPTSPKSSSDENPERLLRKLSQSKLDTSKLKSNDHRIIGKDLDLFSFNESAPGMVFWHNNGLIVYNELINFWREIHQRENYEEISTPQVLDSSLWKVSGHWDKYKENNFVTGYEDKPFLVKPMNCPGGMLVYRSTPKSYKDLPLRVGEIGVVHRNELSGVLAGLFRVIKFTQDDAHIFCADEKQTEQEIIGVAKLIQEFYKKFNLKFDHVELSTRPEKRIGTDEAWDRSEAMLEKTLKKMKIKYKINKGDGAFYGPKIDFHVKDSLGRTWQLSTIQLDFAMPERFQLEYIDKDGKAKRPIMLHRVIYGSIERFIGILLEDTSGALPTWLSPTQVRIINFTDKHTKATEAVASKLKKELPQLRLDTDLRNTTVPDKIRLSETQKIPYTIVIGDKEEKSKTLAVRKRGAKKPDFGVKPEAFIKKLQEEIEKRK